MRGLNKLYYLKLDIENVKDEIKGLTMISSPSMSGMPRGTNISSPSVIYVLKKELLENQLMQLEKKYEAEFKRVSDIIDRIDEPEIQAMARMRFIDNMKWEDIGCKIHLERTTCSKKLKKYLESMDI